MMKNKSWVESPLIYEINTRVWLAELSVKYGKTVTLENVPSEELREIASRGFQAVWLMGVWKPSPEGREIAWSHDGLRGELVSSLPDLCREDVVASPYAVYGYEVSASLGGGGALAAFRETAALLGLKLILDFVPNHTAKDHPWVRLHPDYYVQGGDAELQRDPSTFFPVTYQSVYGGKWRRILAHGKDPYFPGWTDTAQLNYFNPALRAAVKELLLKLASMCDGLRCDMAMLVMNEIHYQIWGDLLFRDAEEKVFPSEFWPEAIAHVREKYGDFLFIAEAYWMKEGPLQDLGFDYTYDKALYDWLRAADAGAIFGYLASSPGFYQQKCLRFTENHDEPRAASVFGDEHNKTAALIMGTLPGARLYHEGQLEGFRIRCPVQLGRRPAEEVNPDLKTFYEKLLHAVNHEIFHRGRWTLLPTYAAWDGNDTSGHFLAWLWTDGAEMRLVAANLSPQRGQCYIKLPLIESDSGACRLTDLLDGQVYDRDVVALHTGGLYLDIGPWYRHLFSVEPV